MVSDKKALMAGAGKSEILFHKEVFPTPGENYTGVHDNPHVRALILKNNTEQIALVNFELVSLKDDIKTFQNIVSELTETPKENVWICVTHTLPTPHLFKPAQEDSREEKEKYRRMYAAVEKALKTALMTACFRMKKVTFGYGTGSCSINVNRVISSDKGWWLGNNEHGITDTSVIVYRFDDSDGNTEAILFNYNAQCSVMDGAYTEHGDRLISADLAGASAAFVEKEFKTTAMYCLGAGGDQAPSLKALRTIRGRNGVLTTKDIHEKGFLLVELLGERLGQEVVYTAEQIICKEFNGMLENRKKNFVYNRQKIPEMKDICPAKNYKYEPDGKIETEVMLLKIGGTAIIGIKPEICAKTAMILKKGSPYQCTGLMTFVNGGAKYMPEKEMYDAVTFQSMNSKFAKGSAELFMKDILDFLEEEYKRDCSGEAERQ